MKAPSSYVLEFALSKKNLLVEGDAEYILMDPFYKKVTGDDLFGSGVSVIAIGGISFPRYLDIAHLLGTRTAVVTDNDGDLQTMCVDRYEDYKDDFIKVFSDPDEARSTFEICVYDPEALARLIRGLST
jgi:putative ATP-dependent endonuclease of OLD family